MKTLCKNEKPKMTNEKREARNTENKPKVWSVQFGKTFNFSIKFSVPPSHSTRARVNSLAFMKPSQGLVCLGGGGSDQKIFY